MKSKRSLIGIFMLCVVAMLAACVFEGGAPDAPAAITAQPTAQSVVVGTAATFTVTASNAASYQWQISTDSGTTFAEVAGATNASYTTPVTVIGDGGKQYRVRVSGASNNLTGYVTSSAVTLTVRQ